MRPRLQQGQILKHGSNWVLRFREERTVDGVIKRVRSAEILAPFSDFPERPTPAIIAQVRERYAERIQKLLAPGNKDTAPAAGVCTLAEFIQHNYFTRLEWRMNVPAPNELHIEPSTIKSYRDIFKLHVLPRPISALKLRNVTPRDAQRFLESLDQNLSPTRLTCGSRTSSRASSHGRSRITHLKMQTRWTRRRPEGARKSAPRTSRSVNEKFKLRTNMPTRWRKSRRC